jgi:hypothetical protein
MGDELVNRLHRRPFFTIEPQRQPNQDFLDLMFLHQLFDVGEIAHERPTLNRLQRLRRPA